MSSRCVLLNGAPPSLVARNESEAEGGTAERVSYEARVRPRPQRMAVSCKAGRVR